MVVFPLVSEEYKRLKVFAAAILRVNKVNKSPLHMAIEASLYDNVTQLFKDCLDLCPKALEPLENGESMPITIPCSMEHSRNEVGLVRKLIKDDVISC